MKATKFFLASVFALLFFVGCEDNILSDRVESFNSLSGSSSIEDMIDTCGIIHGLGLDYIYKTLDSLKEGLISVDTTQSEYEFIELKINEFLLSYGYTVGSFNESQIYPVETNFEELIDGLNFTLTNEAEGLILSLESYTNDMTFGLIDSLTYSNILDSLKLEALNLNDSLESIIVGVGITTIKNSFEYWSINDVHWDSLFQSQEKIHGYFSGKNNTIQWSKKQEELLKADAGGAIKGAVAGFGGGVVGAALGGMFGGMHGSIRKAIEQKYDVDLWWYPF